MSGSVIICLECGREKEHEARGLCQACYARWKYHNKPQVKRIINCSFCGELKPMASKGMCKACYSRSWRNGGVPTARRRRPIKSGNCLSCQKFCERMRKGLCLACYAKRHRANNPGLHKEYDKTQRSKPGYMEKAMMHKRVRRSRKKDLPATLTSAEWEWLLASSGHSCIYCGATGVKLHQEHWIPLSRGGGYTVDNIVPSCRRCNSKKGTKTGDEFVSQIIKETGIWVTQLRSG